MAKIVILKMQGGRSASFRLPVQRFFKVSFVLFFSCLRFGCYPLKFRSVKLIDMALSWLRCRKVRERLVRF